MAADAGIFEKQKIREDEQGRRTSSEIKKKHIKFNQEDSTSFPFLQEWYLTSHPVSAVGFMNTPVSVVREDAMPILCVNAWENALRYVEETIKTSR